MMDTTYNLRKRKIEKTDTPIKYQKRIKNLTKCDIKFEIKDEIKTEVCQISIPKNTDRTICHICKVSIKNTYYSRHLSRHNRNKHCDKCKCEFTKIGFESHKCISTFFCHKCNRKYPSQSKYDSHLRQHSHTDTPKLTLPSHIKCDECGKKVVRASIARHRKLHKRVKLKCVICAKGVNNVDMEKHLKKHEMYDCKLCGLKCKGPRRYSLHMSGHERYDCPECGKQCRSIDKYEMHMRGHKQRDSRRCDKCGETFMSFYDLGAHISAQHNTDAGKGKITCPICYKTVSHLLAHMRCHKRAKIVTRQQKVRSNRWQCQPCLENFRDRKSLDRHIRTSHFSRPQFVCTEVACTEAGFNTLGDLCRHVSVVHRELPQGYAQCHLCAQTVEEIEEHLESHTIAVYDCELCTDNEPFEDLADLRRHIRKHHRLSKRQEHAMGMIVTERQAPLTGRMPCLQCGLRLPSSQLRTHIFTHHPRRYRCRHCYKTFHSLDSLTQHTQDHSVQSISCPLCVRKFINHLRLIAHAIAHHSMHRLSSRCCPLCR